MARVKVTADKAAMSEAAAERMTGCVELAVRERGHAAVALTGGDTPDLLYEMLSDSGRPWRQRIDWAHLHLFWGDERDVPPDHAQSNYGLAYRTLLQHVPVAEEHIHRMRGELPASDAGRLYDALLHARRDHTSGPMFDVMLLGIGSNAHIASIFPNSPLLAGRESRPLTAEDPSDADGVRRAVTTDRIRDVVLATGVAVPELAQWRITMTPAALLDSAVIVIIASGASKADAIEAAIERPLDVARYPAQLLRTSGDRVEWIIDSAAAARLRGVPPA